MTFENPGYSSYSEIVFYRKRWVWVLTMLIFAPIGILIGLTGDVYFNKKGQIVNLPKATRLILSIGFLILMLIKIFGPNFIKQ